MVLARWINEVGFQSRKADQITNKWDNLIEDYKKIKEHIGGLGLTVWWGMSWVKELSRTRQIFGRASDVVNFDCLALLVCRHFGRCPLPPYVACLLTISLVMLHARTFDTSMDGILGDNTPRSIGRKKKAFGIDNLVDFVKDFNHDYLACMEVQEFETCQEEQGVGF